MTFEHIKKRIVKNLISEIECLDATDLELVGHNVISTRESQRLVHHGINKDYKPVGYTVDSFSEDSMIVGEYSTEKNYFSDSPSFSKIEKDIKHALSHNKPEGPNKIYLIANQEEPPSFRAQFNNTSLFKNFGHKIIFLDARELANEIHRQTINNSSYADSYKDFFPGYAQDLSNYEYYGKVPALCDGHISATNINEAISSHYSQGHHIGVLHGLSGSGKTQAAIDFIRLNATQFENYLWISGKDWKQDTSLCSIQRSRGGTPVNVAGIFNAGKTILVIDNMERVVDEKQFGELEKGFENGGVVLVTSQLRSPVSSIYIAIPTLSKNVAIQILGENPNSTSRVCLEFIKACSFSPLMLATARNIIKMQGIDKEVLYTEILEDPECVDGDDGKSIMRRILSKLEEKERKALTQIANSNSSINDLNFLRFFIRINACTNLQRLSILMPTNAPGVVKIHDLVCASMQDEVNISQLVTAIESFIEANSGEMQPSVLRQIHLSYSQILQEHTRRGLQQPDWLSYALLQVEGEKKLDVYKQFYTIQISPEHSLASVMSIIDAQEVHAYTIEDTEKRKNYYTECAKNYHLCFLESKDENIKAELLYHKAKALRRCGRHNDALEEFKKHLELRPNWHATHGQLAHLGSNYGVDRKIKEEGEKSIKILINTILEDSSAVPLRVSLAAIAKLRSYRSVSEEISVHPEKVQKLSDVIATSALEGLDQFYEALVSFTSIFGYHHSLFCVTLAESLPEMETISPESVEKRQWVSACEAFTNTSVAAARVNKKRLSTLLISAAIRFADAIFDKDILPPFNARAVAKTYLAASLPEKALDTISKVSEDKLDHWILYRKTEALLAIEDLSAALENAHSALALAMEDSGAGNRLPSYHELISKCHEALGNKEKALLETNHALKKCDDPKYREALQKRIKYLTAS